MKFFKSLLSLFRNPLYEQVSSFRTFKRNRQRHKNLLSRNVPEVPLAKNIVLLSNRNQLVEFLPQGGNVAEVGVAHGDFSEVIIATNKPRILHLIDLWQGDMPSRGRIGGNEGYQTIQHKFDTLIKSEKVKLHQGFSNEVLASFPEKYL